MTTSAYFTRAANLQRLHDGPLVLTLTCTHPGWLGKDIAD